VRAYDPCLWVDPTGRLWLFWAQSYDQWDGRGGVWAVTTDRPGDEGATFSAPRRLCDGVMMNKPLALSTGAWLLPVGQWNRPARQPHAATAAHAHDLGDRRRSWVYASTDEGNTWSPLGSADVPDRVFDEHMLIERRDGSLWMLVRTGYGIGQSVSTDRGKTWSPGVPTGIPHVNSRFFIRRLRSGKLLLIRHDPPPGSKVRSRLTAYLSDDDGRTWTGGLLLDERTGVSYPDAVQEPNGTIDVIYDYARTGAKQILMTTFAEDDVAAGKPVTAADRSRIVVNQATGSAKKE
jgi:predicted neuraminidase